MPNPFRRKRPVQHARPPRVSAFEAQAPSRLDRLDGLPRRQPRQRLSGPQPLFDQAVYDTGVLPEQGVADVDALIAELDLLALPIATGTLR